MPQEKPFELRVSLSGLIVYVRNGDKITHALLQAAEGHHPLVRVCGADWSSGPHPLSRLRLEVEWYQDGEWQGIDGNGAMPAKVNGLLGDLPCHDNRYDFRWMPDLTSLCNGGKVPKKLTDRPTKPEPIPKEIACQVVLGNGRIRTTQFAWAEERSVAVGERLIPKLACKRPKASQPVEDRAYGEVACWSLPAPEGAEEIRIRARDLKGEDPVSDLARVKVKPDAFLSLEVTDSPPEQFVVDEPHPGRKKGVSVDHFTQLQDLISGCSDPLPVPWIPEEFRRHGSDGNHNVIPETDVPPEDCLGCPDWTSLIDADVEGTYQRPICIPGVADAE